MKELALLFLRLGTTAFGGPAAHIALIQDEVVNRKKWISQAEFLDLVGATNLIPGPNSTELAIHIGYKRAGWKGLLTAGLCFMLPAAVLVSLIAWSYVKFGHLPALAKISYTVKPVIIAVLIQALWGLSKTAVKNNTLAIVALFAFAIHYFGWLNEVLSIFLAGAVYFFYQKGIRPKSAVHFLSFGVLSKSALGATLGALTPFSLDALAFFFFKVGSVLFGSGYVLLAFIRSDLVERYGWLTETQLLDAISVGQFTPGPVFTTATFIGYLLAGAQGAVVATVAIFVPAFVFVALSAPFLPKLRNSSSMSAFLDGVNAASLALLALVSFQLAKTSIIDPLTIGIAVSSCLLLVVFRVNSAWLVGAGALLASIR